MIRKEWLVVDTGPPERLRLKLTAAFRKSLWNKSSPAARAGIISAMLCSCVLEIEKVAKDEGVDFKIDWSNLCFEKTENALVWNIYVTDQAGQVVVPRAEGRSRASCAIVPRDL